MPIYSCIVQHSVFPQYFAPRICAILKNQVTRFSAFIVQRVHIVRLYEYFILAQKTGVCLLFFLFFFFLLMEIEYFLLSVLFRSNFCNYL